VRMNMECADLEQMNEVLLPWDGIGEDHFYLNEFLPRDALLAYQTVDDYARDDHEYQERSRKRVRGLRGEAYQGNLYPSWARLFVEGRFRYVTLWSLAAFLSNRIEERGEERVEQLIPYQLVRGPEDGKREGDHYVWDMREDAGGREAQLEELTTRLFEYQIGRSQVLLASNGAGAFWYTRMRFAERERVARSAA